MILRHNRGLAASPPVRYRLKMPESLFGIFNGPRGPSRLAGPSHRDGFLADRRQAAVNELSIRCRVLRLIAEDRSSGDVTKTVITPVVERGPL
jgi:hypothetical protein